MRAGGEDYRLYKSALTAFGDELPEADMNKPTITFLLGTPFCGSTAVGNILNNVRQGSYLGEVNRLPIFDDNYDGPRNSVPRCLKCENLGSDCSLWGSQSHSTMEALDTVALYTFFAERVGATHIVDGSKAPSHLQLIYPSLSLHFNIRALILTRNPVKSMASYMSARINEGTAIEPWFAANFWRDTYTHAMSLVNSLELPLLTLASESFLDCESIPFRSSLEKLLEFTGTFVGGEIFDGDEMGSKLPGLMAPSHQFAGNERTQGIGTGEQSTSGDIISGAGNELVDSFLMCPNAVDVATLLGIPIGPELRPSRWAHH